VPESRVVHSQIVADLSDHHVTGVEAHPHREADSFLEAKLVRVAAKILLEGERGVTGSLRMILVCDRCTEQRHDPVAGILVDGTFEAVDSIGQDREEAIHDLVPFLGIDLLGEVHRPLHVGEQDRHLLALPFEGGARGQDLFGEVFRSIRTRIGNSLYNRRRLDRPAAAVAKAGARGGSAFRTSGRGSRRSPRSRCRNAPRQDFLDCTRSISRCRLPPDPLRAEWNADDEKKAMTMDCHDNSSRTAFASFKSGVSKPSVNQP
jgi:hypothetical protein